MLCKREKEETAGSMRHLLDCEKIDLVVAVIFLMLCKREKENDSFSKHSLPSPHTTHRHPLPTQHNQSHPR